MTASAYADIVAATEMPKIVRLDDNLWAAAFTLMKLLPARFMLDRAAEEGELGPKSTVIETTSGTFGLGLAMLAALRSHPTILVSDPVLDDDLRRRLEYLGAAVEIVQTPAQEGGFQAARLNRVQVLRDLHPDHYVPSQYDNPNNPRAYEAVGEHLLEALGSVDCLVGCVGSGGSMCGIASLLRANGNDVTAIGVDTHGSVLFGFPDAPRLLRGLGNSIMPPNLDHSLFDEVHLVSAEQAFAATHLLHQAKAMFMGPTSGAAYLVANWWASQNRDAQVVALLPDEGHRYTGTVYNTHWLATNAPTWQSLQRHPNLANDGTDLSGVWDRLNWNRRSLTEFGQSVATTQSESTRP